MLILTVILIALATACAVLFLVELVPGNRQTILARRLAELHGTGSATSEILHRRRRRMQADKLTDVIEALGQRVERARDDIGALRRWLVQAGFAGAAAVSFYLGLRIYLPATLGIGTALVLPAFGSDLMSSLLYAVWLACLGYTIPPFFIASRRRARQREMQKALPDALDTMVICVEAGLGLNQALVRVTDEIRRVSTVLGDQLSLVNLEIRAGTPREEALRSLGERTGLDDVKSLVAMLVQTDRFGTSIAQALRVQSDSLRTKRRQRAEEAAAKTSIKLVFPLVLFIFPAMFVVILGPALIQIVHALQGFR